MNNAASLLKYSSELIQEVKTRPNYEENATEWDEEIRGLVEIRDAQIQVITEKIK